MERVYHQKLVRDGIKLKIEARGKQCSVRVLSDDTEFKQALLQKLNEEAIELSKTESREDFLREYADLMIVLDALTSHLEISEAEIQVAMSENIAAKGWFKERHFLEWTEEKNE